MREAATYVTQSRFFSPVFNAAIFDGPIRIYFSQAQEAQALKLYFNLQERFNEIRRQAQGIFRDRTRNIFVMIYPNEETFETTFGQEEGIVRDRLGSDFVVGVRGPMEESILDELCSKVGEIVHAAEA